MKLTVKTPDITQYRFAFELEDDLHHRCMWADINLDHDTYTMTATTDCGNYSYWWKATPKTESFRELMARISGDYLLPQIEQAYKTGTMLPLLPALGEGGYQNGN